MTQPSFVPITESAHLRPVMDQPFPRFRSGRPSEVREPEFPLGEGIGSPGPDQGYALTLAHRMSDRLVLTSGEEAHDVEVGAALLASRRASLFGRAPSIYDIQVALGLFGYLAPADDELVVHRRALFGSIGHSYVAQRELADHVPESSLRLSPQEVEQAAGDWRQLLDL